MSAAHVQESIAAQEPQPLDSRERKLHYLLAKVVSYPRWVSIGSIDSHAELPPISRALYDEIQEALRHG